MKITEICESTTAGSVATVATPMNGGPLKRSAVGKGVYGKEPAGSLFTGKKFANSVKEGAGENSKSQTPLFGRDFKECHRCFGRGKQSDGYRCHVCNGTGMVDLKTPHNGGRNNQTNEEGGFPGELVTVIYVDGTPVVKYANPEEADKAIKLLRKRHPEAKVKFQQEVIKEAGMPSPVAKHKQKLSGMSDAELAERLKDKSDDELKKMAERHGYGKMSLHYVNRVNKGKKINEGELQETDLIIVPGQGHRLKSGFISHAEDRRDHEVEMARSDLHQAHKNSSKIHRLIKNVSEDDGLEGWVQAKITKAADYLNSVCQYLEGKQLQEMTGGVIAGGGVGESLSEGKHDSYNLRDLGNDLNNYVGSDSESVLVTKILNILRNNYTDSRGKNLPNREIAGSELMSLYGISKRDQGAFINFIDKVYGGPKKDEEDSYNSFRFDEEADHLDEGMGLKQLAAIAAAFGFNLVPNNVGDGTSGRSPADSAYDTYLSQTPSHLIPRYTAPAKAK